MKVYKNIVVIIILCLIFISNIDYINAANLTDWFSELKKAAGNEGAGYVTEVTGPEPMISTVIQVTFSFLGVIFLALMIYGGYLWMTALGSEEQVGRAKKLIIAAVIGLVVIVSAYAISYLVISKFGGATLAPAPS